MRSLFRYEEKKSLLHGLDPRVKMLWLFGVSVLSVVLGTPFLLAALFFSTLPFWYVLSPSRARIKALVFLFGSIAGGFVVSQSLFYYWAKTPLFTLVPATFPLLGPLTGGIFVYSDGAVYGLYQSFRFLACSSAAMLVLATSHPGELILALSRFFELKPGKKRYRIGLPYEIAFMLASAVSFAPTMVEECGVVLNAMQARGLELKGGLRGRAKALKYIFFPMTVNVLRAGRQLAIAADARGFRAGGQRTCAKELALGRGDFLFLAYTLLFTAAGLYLSYTGFGATVPV